jgi:hypothetical protein
MYIIIYRLIISVFGYSKLNVGLNGKRSLKRPTFIKGCSAEEE